MTFEFSRISKTNLKTLVEYLQKYFLNNSACYFQEIEVSYVIFDILKEADRMLFEASADNFCYVPTFLLYISWKYNYWRIQKSLCNIVQPLDK